MCGLSEFWETVAYGRPLVDCSNPECANLVVMESEHHYEVVHDMVIYIPICSQCPHLRKIAENVLGRSNLVEGAFSKVISLPKITVESPPIPRSWD